VNSKQPEPSGPVKIFQFSTCGSPFCNFNYFVEVPTSAGRKDKKIQQETTERCNYQYGKGGEVGEFLFFDLPADEVDAESKGDEESFPGHLQNQKEQECEEPLMAIFMCVFLRDYPCDEQVIPDCEHSGRSEPGGNTPDAEIACEWKCSEEKPSEQCYAVIGKSFQDFDENKDGQKCCN